MVVEIRVEVADVLTRRSTLGRNEGLSEERGEVAARAVVWVSEVRTGGVERTKAASFMI